MLSNIFQSDVMGSTLPIALLLFALGGAAMAWPLVNQERGRNDLKRRLKVDMPGLDLEERRDEAKSRPQKIKVQNKALKKAQEFYANSDPENVARLRMKLIQGGYLDPRAVGLFFMVRVGASCTLALVATIVTMLFGFHLGENDWVAVMGAGLAGYFLPGLVLGAQIRSKVQEYRNGFPDFMDLMIVCTDAGMSMEAGIDRVSREIGHTYPSLSQNLQLVSLELRAGRTLNDALKSLADRLCLDEVRSFATLLQQSKELGTSLSGALRVFSEEMRHKRMSRAEEKAHALPAKMSVPVTACILPVVLLVAIIPVIVQLSHMK